MPANRAFLNGRSKQSVVVAGPSGLIGANWHFSLKIEEISQNTMEIDARRPFLSIPGIPVFILSQKRLK
jgi:hypothetical protein